MEAVKIKNVKTKHNKPDSDLRRAITIDEFRKKTPKITDKNTNVKKRVYYEPDEDFYNSITIDELQEEVLKFIDELDKKYTNESNSITSGYQILK